MNREKLIEVLMQAGFEYTSDLLSKLDKFEKLLEIEREECAHICDHIAIGNAYGEGYDAAFDCGFKIRARGSNV